MDGGASFYIMMAAAAAGTAVSVSDSINSNRERQRVLEQELRSNELAALDEENERLIALREANEEILAGAGNIDPYASPSLLAARAFNFEMGMQDIENIRFNVANARAGVSARIGILKRNSRVATTKGIFELIGIGASTANQGSLLKKSSPGPVNV